MCAYPYVPILHILSRIMVSIRTLFLHVLHVAQTSTDGKKGHIATERNQLFCSTVFGDTFGLHTRN